MFIHNRVYIQHRFFLFLVFALISTVIVSESYGFPSTMRTKILPKGRRALAYSELSLTVPGKYNSSGQFSTFEVGGSLQFTDLGKASDKIEKAIATIDEISPNLSEKLVLGSFQFDPQVEGHVKIFGLGWGITDKLMIGVGVPIINATVKMKGAYASSGVLVATAGELREAAKTAKAEKKQQLEILAQILDKAPTVTPQVLQNYFVTEMGYEPLGTWSANDLGDARVFMHYNYYENTWAANGVRWGLDVPTGRRDNPDIINDFAFGSETYAPFIETIHDIAVWGPRLTLSVSASYKYFLPSEKTVRLLDDVAISDKKESVHFKKGDSLEYLVGATSEVFRNTQVFAQLVLSESLRDAYQGLRADYDYKQLSNGSKSDAQTVTYGLSYSTVNQYLAGNFFLPMTLTLSSSEMARGVDIEKIKYQQLDLQVYF